MIARKRHLNITDYRMLFSPNFIITNLSRAVKDLINLQVMKRALIISVCVCVCVCDKKIRESRAGMIRGRKIGDT